MMLNQASIETFTANIYGFCNFDTTSLQNKRLKISEENCNFFETITKFKFEENHITISVGDDTSNLIDLDDFVINKSVIETGINTYYCEKKDLDIIVYYYKPIGLVKMYQRVKSNGKTFVYLYLQQKN